MIVSPTEIATYKRCKRKWRYYSSNANNLEPFTTRPEFVMGIAIHEALGKYISEGADPVQVVHDSYYEHMQLLTSEYENRLKVKPSVIELEPLMEDKELAASMMENYVAYWKRPIPENFSLLDTEQEIKLDIPGTEHQLMIRLDALLLSDDCVYVLEHKTYSQKPNVIALVMDEQFTAYTWAANQLDVGNVVGLLYDGMWKRSTPPRGRVMDDLFSRQVLQRSKLQLREYEHELVAVIKDIETAPEYKTVPWNGCVDCAYSKLCQAETNHEDVTYIMNTFYRKKHSREVVATDD